MRRNNKQLTTDGPRGANFAFAVGSKREAQPL